MKPRQFLPVFLGSLLLNSCWVGKSSSNDPKEVARFFLSTVPSEVELVQGEYHYYRHPDAPRFGFLDMRMGERDWRTIASNHGLTSEKVSRLASARWPIGLKPIDLNNAKVDAGPLIVMIRESNSNRVVVLPIAQFPGWYPKP